MVSQVRQNESLSSFASLKVGYFPHNNTLRHPGDRRRFVFFAKETRIPFEIADARKEYDVVFLTSSCNVSEWIAYKKQHPRTRLVFELIDSYLLEQANVKMYLKGAARFVTGKDKNLFVDYRKAFIEIIRIADAVVCSTPVQQALIEQYNKNVHVSLDYFENEISEVKSDYKIGEKLKLVWEGQSYTVENILILSKVFKEIENEIELHVITDKLIPYPLGLSKKTKTILDKLKVEYHFHEWKFDTFASQAIRYDLALIPLDSKKAIMWNKPENKLLFFWQAGLPALTSPSPSYTRVMNAAGIQMYAANEKEWVEKILRYKFARESERAALLKKMKAYIGVHHSKEIILNRWKRIFQLN
ncbi:MAG: hypothetical protein SH857_08335 [Chitinophagales bacterium]|nr:hypothetical protein [Chitinophagales bacterium]